MLAELEVFFDGDCPLCRREIAFARRLDGRGAVRFTDIADPSFDPSSSGISRADLMARIHARTEDGSVVEGVGVSRRLYAAVGLGPLVVLSRIGPLARLLDAAYTWFAENRLRITGRCEDGTCAR